jgi:Zn-dependent protease
MPDQVTQCHHCGASLPANALVCLACAYPVHADLLDQIAVEARRLESTDPAQARQLWIKALALLPPDSKQAEAIRSRIERLTPKPPQADTKPTGWQRFLGPLGVMAAFFAKFKTLLFGLGNLKTLVSMFAFFGLYWATYGWKFALGFVLGIYVHEMGHFWELKKFGFQPSAPMFIPGMGAFVSWTGTPQSAGQGSRIALAGPIWGSAAAIFFVLAGQVMSPAGLWMALANATAFINLLNLIPVQPFDGGRGLGALDRNHRVMLLSLMAVAWLISQQHLLILLGLGTLYRTFGQKDFPAEESDTSVFIQFATLIVLLVGLRHLASVAAF